MSQAKLICLLPKDPPPHAIPRRRRAGSRTGGRERPALPLLSILLLHSLHRAVYFSPAILRFLTSSFAAATRRRLRGRLSLNSGIYELRRGERSAGVTSDDELAVPCPRARARDGMYVCACVTFGFR